MFHKITPGERRRCLQAGVIASRHALKKFVLQAKRKALMEKTLDVHEQQAREKTRMYHVAPVLVLIVLAPTLAEVLLGNLLINRDFVWALVINTLLYGSGAILIREVAQRCHLGWPGIVALALAFGVVEEGLVLQS